MKSDMTFWLSVWITIATNTVLQEKSKSEKVGECVSVYNVGDFSTFLQPDSHTELPVGPKCWRNLSMDHNVGTTFHECIRPVENFMNET